MLRNWIADVRGDCPKTKFRVKQTTKYNTESLEQSYEFPYQNKTNSNEIFDDSHAKRSHELVTVIKKLIKGDTQK